MNISATENAMQRRQARRQCRRRAANKPNHIALKIIQIAGGHAVVAHKRGFVEHTVIQ